MDLSGEYRIAAALPDVWRGLNDPEVLARCIDGCRSMQKVGDDQFQAVVKAKVGPVTATFQALLAMTDVQPLAGYVINADIKGGAAGFGKGAATVRLAEAAGATLLSYEVKASVGGKLAQVGSRLIDATARKMADHFFLEFGREVSGAEPEATGATLERTRYQPSHQLWIWLVVFAILALVMVLVY
ncbi:MAG: carbon monoxide dehydrogenase [Chromatiales bacterium]|nr:MAG: carbon monoxide dehydrogenase [Chromatiales bacterium]